MQNFTVRIPEQLYVGMNNKYPSHLLPSGVFASITNAFIEQNKIYKRGGTTAIADSLGAFVPLGGAAFETTTGTKEIIVCRNGSSNAQLYKWTGSGTFSAIGSANLTAGAYMNFVMASDKLFGFNGTDVVDYDGTTVTKNRAGVPKGKFAFWFHNYLFVGGVSGVPNRLYWSNLGDPTTFDAANYVDINANDGDSLTALNTLNDELIVFKNYSIWAISGWSGATFSATTIAGQNTSNRGVGGGTPSHQSVVSTGRDLYYLSFLGSVPHIRSLNQTIFAKTVESGIASDEIEGTMNGLNKATSALVKCSGIYDGKFVYWTIANGASTTNNLILCFYPSKTWKTSLGGMDPWSIFTGANIGQFFSSTISGTTKIYGTDATTGGKVFLFNDTSSYEDDDTAVTMTIETRDYQADPARQGNYVYLYHKYLSGSAGTLTVSARIDQAADYTLQDTISLAGNSPGLGTFILGTSVLGGATITQARTTLKQLTGNLLGLKFVEATSNACTLYDHEILGFLKGYRL